MLVFGGLLAVIAGGDSAPGAAPDPPPRGLRTVALTGTPLPGLPPGAEAEQFGSPQVDARGRVSFEARLRPSVGGVTLDNNFAVWSEAQPGQAVLAARSGDPVSGTDYRHETSFSIATSSTGSLTIHSALLHESFYTGGEVPSGQAAIASGVLRLEPDGDPQLLFTAAPIGVPSVPAATTATGVVGFATPLSINDQDQIVTRTGSGSGPIFTFDEQVGLQNIGRGAAPIINEFGDVLYRVTNTADEFLAVRNPRRRPTTEVATEGDPAPDAAGATFNRFFAWSNNGGSAMFTAQLAGLGVDDTNDYGVWSESEGLGSPLQKVLREGDPAPGVDDGSVFAGFDAPTSAAQFGRGGGLAVSLDLAGPNVNDTNDSGFWVGDDPFDLRLVMREGDPAPGVPGGRFGPLLQSGVVSADGRGVFTARLAGTDDTGIWGEDVDGTLRLIAKHGDEVRLPSGEVTQLRFPRVDEGVGPNGHVAIYASLTSGQIGLFVSDAIAVPEPFGASALACGVAILAMAGRRTTASWSVHSALANP